MIPSLLALIAMVTGYSAAPGIALVTSVTNFGGFVGPFTVGLIHERTGSFYPGLIDPGRLIEG